MEYFIFQCISNNKGNVPVLGYNYCWHNRFRQSAPRSTLEIIIDTAETNYDEDTMSSLREAFQIACLSSSPSVDIVQYVDELMIVRGTQEAIIRKHNVGKSTMYYICANEAVTIFDRIEGGQQGIIKANYFGEIAMHCICANEAVTDDVIQAVASIFESIERGSSKQTI